MFKWLDSYSVGVPLFDTQHQKIFDLANQLFVRLQDHNSNLPIESSVRDIIHELVRYTQYHFSQEEKMMRLYRFPEIDAHISEHHEFVNYLDAIDFDSIDTHAEAIGKDLLLKLIQWITSHIQKTDQKYSVFLMKAFAQKP